MNYLCFYDSTENQSLLSAWILKYKYDDGTDTISFIDTAGDNEATIDSHISGLDDDTYHEVWVTVDVAQTHAAGNLIYDQVAALRAKMATGYKGSTVTSGDCQNNTTVTEVVLESGASATNDTYNSQYIEIVFDPSGTPTTKYRQIKDYVGSTRTATVNTTTSAADDDNSDTYTIFTADYVNLFGARSSGKEACLRVWEDLYSGITPPKLVQYMSYYQFAVDLGTAQAADSTTITIQDTADAGSRIADGDRANDSFNDMYVYLYSGTGDGQYAKIDDYVLSTEVATLDDTGWVATGPNTTTPSGTPVYRIVEKTGDILKDAYTELFVRTYFDNLSKASAYTDFKDLIDKNRTLSGLSSGDTVQDLDLLDQYLDKGKSIFDYNSL